MKIPALSLLERLAVWILHRSSRTGLVIVKPRDCTQMSYSVHQEDAEAQQIANEVFGYNEPDPPSLELERLYHLPAYGEE